VFGVYIMCLVLLIECMFSLCRVSELLQGGAVMNKSFQPHEAHIPFLLQLFIDYNLYGMNMISLAAVKFRKSGATGNAFRHSYTQEEVFARIFIIKSLIHKCCPLRKRLSDNIKKLQDGQLLCDALQ